MTVAKDNHKGREAVIAKLTDVEDGLLGRRQLGPDQVLRLGPDVTAVIPIAQPYGSRTDGSQLAGLNSVHFALPDGCCARLAEERVAKARASFRSRITPTCCAAP
jgi:hypothetical protein